MKKRAIRIGVVLPLSGDEELFGSQGLQGARMAVAEVLRSGGSVAGEEYLAIAVKNYDGYIAKIMQSGSTVAFMMLSGLAGQIFIRRFKELGLHGRAKLVKPEFNED